MQDDLQKIKSENLDLRKKIQRYEKKENIAKKKYKTITSFFLRFFVGENLHKSCRNLVNELPNSVTKESVADLAANVILRFTRIGIFLILTALIPYILLLQQNRLISNQNKRIDQQTELAEANRRSSANILMYQIYQEIQEELKQDSLNNLSNSLINKIVTTSNLLKPYKYLDGDKLTKRQLSPERGQLLLFLVNSELSEKTYKKIFKNANFSYSDLEMQNLKGSYLEGINLRNSSFRSTNFEYSNIYKADLSGADLRWANFENCDLRDTEFYSADIRGCDFSNANLIDANFSNVSNGDILSWRNSIKYYFVKQDINDIDFVNYDYQADNLTAEHFLYTSRYQSNLFILTTGIDFSYANLVSTYFTSDFDFGNCSMHGASFLEAKEMRPVSSWDIKGKEFISHFYNILDFEIKSVKREGWGGKLKKTHIYFFVDEGTSKFRLSEPESKKIIIRSLRRMISEDQKFCEKFGSDSDSDGICDYFDNCHGTYNPDQSDTDLDSEGDACDTVDKLKKEGIYSRFAGSKRK